MLFFFIAGSTGTLMSSKAFKIWNKKAAKLELRKNAWSSYDWKKECLLFTIYNKSFYPVVIDRKFGSAEVRPNSLTKIRCRTFWQRNVRNFETFRNFFSWFFPSIKAIKTSNLYVTKIVNVNIASFKVIHFSCFLILQLKIR